MRNLFPSFHSVEVVFISIGWVIIIICLRNGGDMKLSENSFQRRTMNSILFFRGIAGQGLMRFSFSFSAWYRGFSKPTDEDLYYL